MNFTALNSEYFQILNCVICNVLICNDYYFDVSNDKDSNKNCPQNFNLWMGKFILP